MRNLLALILAVCLSLTGCVFQVFDRPPTPDVNGYIELHPLTYDDYGQPNGVVTDPTAGPILILWDTGQAGIRAVKLATYWFPKPVDTQTSQPYTPVAAFIGHWSGTPVVGDTLHLDLSHFELPESIYVSATGFATAVWDTTDTLDIVHIVFTVTVESGTGPEVLTSYATLGRYKS